MHTKVDIILPSYNKDIYLEESINSIVQQKFNNWKLIIIDNCSTDNSREIIRKYSGNEKISTFFLKKNMGVSFSRNLGVRLSDSKYISFIDADDIWNNSKLQNQIEFMEKNNYNFTYTDYTPFFDKKIRIFKKEIITPSSFDYKKFLYNSSIGTSSMILSRKIIGVIKFPKVKTLEDFSFKCEILKNNNAIKFNENNTFYRITKNSLTSNKLKNLYWLWHINKKYNKLNFLNNLKSLVLISLRSLNKYGFK